MITIKTTGSTGGFDCCSMEFHMRNAEKSLLISVGIVEMNIVLNCVDQLLFINKFIRFQNSPEPIHCDVINESSDFEYTLQHFRFFSFDRKALLISTVTVNQ